MNVIKTIKNKKFKKLKSIIEKNDEFIDRRFPSVELEEFFKLQKGEISHSPYFVIRKSMSDTPSRFAISISKKVANTAVLRNKTKRRVYSIIEALIPNIISKQKVVIVVKAETLKLKQMELKKEIEKAFVKCGLLK